MKKNGLVLKALGIGCTVVGLVITVVKDYVDDVKLEELVEKKVSDKTSSMSYMVSTEVDRQLREQQEPSVYVDCTDEKSIC